MVSSAKKRKIARSKQVGGPYKNEVSLNHVRISPRKMRLVVDMVRGEQVEPALQILKFSKKRGAKLLEKLLRSGVMNAKQAEVDVDKLWISKCSVDMGKTLFRFFPRAQGRAAPIRKRSSHITLVLETR